MLQTSARIRPKRSAKTPNTMPPTADATSVNDAIDPPVAALIFRSAMSVASTSA